MALTGIFTNAAEVLFSIGKQLIEFVGVVFGPRLRTWRRAPLIPEEPEIRGDPPDPAEPRPDRIPGENRRFDFVTAASIEPVDREYMVTQTSSRLDREPLPTLAHVRVGDYVGALIDCPARRQENCSWISGRVVFPKRDSLRVRIESIVPGPHGLERGGWLDIPHAAVLVALPFTAAG